MTNSEEHRRSIKSASPKVILEDCHVANCRVLPGRENLLDRIASGGVCAEIGVDDGDFTNEIIARCKPKKIHLVDAWSSERYRDQIHLVEKKFADQIAGGSVQLHVGKSTDIMRGFADQYFDWVYIDTDHTYLTTRDELVLSRLKTKPGGRITGHDFTSGNSIKPWPYGVIEACNEFCVLYGWEYEFLTLESHGHFSFCLKEIA